MVLLSKQGRGSSPVPLDRQRRLFCCDKLVRPQREAQEKSSRAASTSMSPGGRGQPEAEGLFPATLARCPPLSREGTSGTRGSLGHGRAGGTLVAHPSALVAPSPSPQCVSNPSAHSGQNGCKAPALALPTFSPGKWGSSPPLEGHLGPPAPPVLGGPTEGFGRRSCLPAC